MSKVNIDTASDINKCGMTMKKREFVVEEKDTQEHEPKKVPDKSY